jgi:hypothetical protein
MFVMDGIAPPDLEGASFSNSSSVASLSGGVPSVNGYSAHTIVFWIKGTWSSSTDEQIFGYIDAGSHSTAGWLIRIEDGKLVVVQGNNSGDASITADGKNVYRKGKRWISSTRLSDASGYNTSGWNCVFIQLQGNTANYGYSDSADVQQTTTNHMYVNHTSIGCTLQQDINVNVYTRGDYIKTAVNCSNDFEFFSSTKTQISPENSNDNFQQDGDTGSTLNRTVTLIGAGASSGLYTGVVVSVSGGDSFMNVTPAMSTPLHGGKAVFTSNNLKVFGVDISPANCVIGAISRVSPTLQKFTGSLGPIYLGVDTFADWSSASKRNKWTDTKGLGFHRASNPPTGFETINNYGNGSNNVTPSGFTTITSAAMISSGTSVSADSTKIRQI